ncbi:MAG: hypothetical protein IPM16_17605 [Chloroflexi bacterium]|nr:hypothetical protein [Chloroflexota bacterium]
MNADTKDQRELARLGVSVDLGVGAFEVDEANVHWPEIREWARRHRAVVFAWTEFTPEEIQNAAYVFMFAHRAKGYPQPENGYEDITYDLSNYCARCGVGKVQKAPFRLKGEPKWGKTDVFQVNWVGDEFFVKPDVWQRAFEPLGVRKREVLSAGGKLLTTVVQLAVDEYVDVDVNPETGTPCPECGQTKYAFTMRGMFPGLKEPPTANLVRTRQTFGPAGGGASAYQPLLASQQLVQSLQRHKVTGVGFWPVAEST